MVPVYHQVESEDLWRCCGLVCDFGISRPRGYKTFPCSTQLSIKNCSKILKHCKRYVFLAFKFSYGVFILLINVKMPKIVGILIFMCKINFVLS